MVDHGNVAEFYGRWATLYDLVATRTPGLGSIRAHAVEALALEPGDVVVDMGCGTGANLPFLREAVGASGRVLGLDLTPGVLVHARRRIERAGWTNVEVARADAARPPVGRADAILGSFVVGMFADPRAVIGGWCDLLRAGGRVGLLDAAPRRRSGPLDVAFRLFVAATAPPTARFRYPESPAARLGDRVDASRAVLAERGDIVHEDRRYRGFLRLAVASL